MGSEGSGSRSTRTETDVALNQCEPVRSQIASTTTPHIVNSVEVTALRHLRVPSKIFLAWHSSSPTEPNTGRYANAARARDLRLAFMLLTPRLYGLSLRFDRDSDAPRDVSIARKGLSSQLYRHAAKMLLLHQTGSVKVGEVVRYTLTYTPSADRILPAPSHLHVKIKNTSATPLRAAYLHGPYTLYVACYPCTFDPNRKHEKQQEEGAPDYEPNLKAGGHWTSKLTVPEDVRASAGGPTPHESLQPEPKNFTWIIEIASQVVFSTTAAVHFEVLVGRDEKSVDLGFHGVVVSGHGAPGKLEDHQQGRRRNAAQPKGVFSKAVRLTVDDTESLWNTPAFPTWDEEGKASFEEAPHHGNKADARTQDDNKPKKRKKIHLVLLTHGLHSNLGADMLYLKESIDAAAKQARQDMRKRRIELRNAKILEENQAKKDSETMRSSSAPEIAVAPTEKLLGGDDDESDEHVLVRGFNGNAVKTERGIQYLGKRLAKYVLSITYPDQPYLPVKSSISKSVKRSLTGQMLDGEGKPSHKNSSIVRDEEHRNDNLAYTITSISFVSHSLGGLIQTYAIAYIQKHSPDFFDRITPINFVAMASPFLGLSNENPMYVRFALDFGLVGRTGQDLGLTWRAPTMVRSGWGAMIGGLGNEAKKNQNQPDPGSKPLLRILPTGPAHIALKRFRNRSVYSNVVNDGIVPLRTSCLLFLDWRGLGRVEKARRDNGLVGTMVGWGWAEMTGQNASMKRKLPWNDLFGDSGDDGDETDGQTKKKPQDGSHDHRQDVPQAEAGESLDNMENGSGPIESQMLRRKSYHDEASDKGKELSQPSAGVWTGMLALFKPQGSSNAPQSPHKQQKPYLRGQTMMRQHGSQDSVGSEGPSSSSPEHTSRPGNVRGSSLYTTNSKNENLEAPPKTTFFESAGDLLDPPLPPKEFLVDPESRPRTIFHDRVYHPEDIPKPPKRRQRSFLKRSIGHEDELLSQSTGHMEGTLSKDLAIGDPGDMKIEEKIARAYHKDMSWRKVLVRLEPDAHNNMIVRRMFANAYGWPVVKHLCDTHFAYTAAAEKPDEEEDTVERAKAVDEVVGEHGEEVKGQTEQPEEPPKTDENESRGTRSADHSLASDDLATLHEDMQNLNMQQPAPVARTNSELRESVDKVEELVSSVPATGESSFSSMKSTRSSPSKHTVSRENSAKWSDRFFGGSEEDDSDEEYLEKMSRTKAQHGKLGDRSGRSKGTPSTPTGVLQGPRIASHLTAEPKPLAPDTGGETPLQATATDGKPDQVMLGLNSVGVTRKDGETDASAAERSSETTPKGANWIGRFRKFGQ